MLTKHIRNQIATAITQATVSTSHVKDDALRKIAFERVLEYLLKIRALGNGGPEDGLLSKRVKASSSKHEPVRVTTNKKTSGPRSWLGELIDENFFSKPKSMKDILSELKNRSHHLEAPDLTLSLEYFCHEKKLRRLPKEKGKRLQWVKW